MAKGIINWIATTEFIDLSTGRKVNKKITFMLPEYYSQHDVLLRAVEEFKELGYYITIEDIKIKIG